MTFTILDAAYARRMASDAVAAGEVLVWTIASDGEGEEARVVARPHRRRGAEPLPCALVAPTLDAVRDLLPAWLAKLPAGVVPLPEGGREPLETWF